MAKLDKDIIIQYALGELSSDEIVRGLKQGIMEGAFLPALCGCGVKNIGTDVLLDALVNYCSISWDRAFG